MNCFNGVRNRFEMKAFVKVFQVRAPAIETNVHEDAPMTNVVHEEPRSQLFSLPGIVHHEIFNRSALGPVVHIGLG